MTATATRTRRTRKPAAPKHETRAKRGRPAGHWVIECDADALYTVRGFANMTQARLAKVAGVSTGTIGNLESGARIRCSVEVAQRIATALEKPVKELFTLRKLDV